MQKHKQSGREKYLRVDCTEKAHYEIHLHSKKIGVPVTQIMEPFARIIGGGKPVAAFVPAIAQALGKPVAEVKAALKKELE